MKKKKKNLKTQKNQERKKIKRKAIVKNKSNTSPQKKVSFSTLKKNIIQIPKLIFEPEIDQVQFNHEIIKANFEKQNSILNEFNLYFKEDTQAIERIKMALYSLANRLDVKEKTKLSNIQTLLQILETEEHKYINQLVIAKYLKARKDATGEGEELTVDNVIEIVDTYGDQFIADGKTDDQIDVDGTDNNETDNETIKKTYFENLQEKIIEDVGHVEADETISLLEADSEAFLIDFIENEKLINDVNDISLALLKEFLRDWFIPKLQPSVQDMKDMLSSLKIIFIYFECNKGFDMDAHECIEHLEKREEFYISLIQ